MSAERTRHKYAAMRAAEYRRLKAERDALAAQVEQLRAALRKVPMPSTTDSAVFWDAWEAARDALAPGAAE